MRDLQALFTRLIEFFTQQRRKLTESIQKQISSIFPSLSGKLKLKSLLQCVKDLNLKKV
jgi:hypothetical protein